MIINHNISAMNTYRQLTINNTFGSKSLEKLSSGLRINRAGDDAAGLAISEKMRGQIRGLNMAAKNAQDGISLIQTAEGALNETHSILQRMRELAVQAASDTNTKEDRAEIQKEINELATEITRIANTTEFNTQNLLGGDFNAKFHIGANEEQHVALAISAMDAKALEVASEDGIKLEVTTEGVANFDNSTQVFAADVAGKTFDVQEVEAFDGAGLIDAKYILVDDEGKAVAASADGVAYTLFSNAVELDSLTSAAAAEYGDMTQGNGTLFDSFNFVDPVTSGKVTFSEDPAGTISATGTHNIHFEDAKLESGTYTVVNDSHHLIAADEYGLVDSKGNLVAVSADGEGWKSIGGDDLFAVSSANAFITPGTELVVASDGGIDVSTQDAADSAIKVINNAIETVSAERSKLGAMQNRLDHTINNLTTASENLQAAESRIRDVDYAAAA